MRYLDFTMVLPLGTPHPDISGQPALNEFIPPALWGRRLELQLPGPEDTPEDPAVSQFREASERWLQAVREHAKAVERKHNLEFCNWSVHSSYHQGAGPVIRISHAEDENSDPHLCTPRGAELLLLSPRDLSEIPGWEQSSELQRQAVRDALRSFINRHRTS